ncbi:MAG: SUMF1/EgtB/PvdO family nonheme iron enzyme [Prevotella sp.]|nr:SUMF1/EgtB/PvdO family nonheme iron enzyme [Prevotella sp.]
MKKIIILILGIVVFASCEKEDDVNLAVSQSELSFTAESSEQIVDIMTDAYWNYEYSAEWLLVRQQQDKIRVIVSENPTTAERSDVIKITVNGATQREIKVTQEGAEITIDGNTVNVSSKGETIAVPIQSNVKWTVDNQIEWCSIQKNGSNLEITVDRNYKMEERSGAITIHSGEVSHDITITQQGCEWFESFEMVEVEEGRFFMGAQKSYSSEANYDVNAFQIEAPVHQVSLSTYAIGKFEVTQAQWVAAMGSNPSTNQGDNLPVENVTWQQVQEFITLLNEASGLNYRLPTEAEWEFAAKGGNLSDGLKYSGNSVLGACGWYYSNSEATTHEVGTKEANELGIYDMSGNVREWCNDWFGSYEASDMQDPQGTNQGNLKVNRGGSWATPAVNCRNTYRHTDYPNESALDLGFRLAISSEGMQ